MSLPGQLTALLLYDDLIVQGQDYTLRCPLYREGRLVVPESGTVSVQDPDGELVVDSAPVELVDGVATYTVLAAVTADLPRREGWVVLWGLVVEGRRQPVIRNQAALVRTHLYPVVTDQVIYRRMPALDPRRDGAMSRRETYQPQIDEAWADILSRLASRGDRPERILSPSALREPHVYLTIALILEDMDGGTNERLAELAERYRGLYEKAWERFEAAYDANDDGQPDSKRRSVRGSWLCGR